MQTTNQGAPLPMETEDRSSLALLRGKLSHLFRHYAGQEAIPGILYFFIGVLFARTPLGWGAYPLGIALLCAQRRHMLPATIGLFLGAAGLGVEGLVYGGLFVIAFLLRVLFSYPKLQIKAIPKTEELFGEVPQLQVSTAVLSAGFAGVYRFAVAGLSADTLLYFIGMVGGAGVGTGLLTGLFSASLTLDDVLGRRGSRPVRRSRTERLWLEAGVVTLLALTVYALGDYSLFGLHFGYLLAGISTLFVARRFGALRGCALGLLVSVGANPLYAPAFGLLGLVTGGLWTLGAFYSLTFAAVAAIAWSSFVSGVNGFLDTAPEIGVAVLLAFPLLPRLYSDAIAGEVRQDRVSAEEAVRAVIGKEEKNTHIYRMSQGFRALSGTLSEVGFGPDPAECFGVCDAICTRYCAGCERRAKCWDGEVHPGAEALTILSDAIATGGTVSAERLPTVLLTECKHLDTMIREVRVAGADLWRECRRRAGADYPAPDYAITAELLEEAAKKQEKEDTHNPALAGTIRTLLRERGLRPAVVSVRGEREKKIVIGCGEFGTKQKEAAAAVGAMENACGCRLSPPVFDVSGEVVTMETHTAKRYGLEVAYVRRPADGSLVSGDCVGIFHAPDGNSYVVLSDGMGTGENAAGVASIAATFLDKMLTAGTSEEISLKLLNRLLSVKGGECSATVDLLRFDTYYGTASFLKSGAASSYVRRDGNLFRLRSKTIPLGLVKELDAERLKFDTRDGDVIVMLSDGISQTSEDAPWLMDLLSKPLGGNLQNAAAMILEEGARQTGSRDDMTVIIARVCELNG